VSVLARWCFRHRLVVVFTWVAVLAALGGLFAAFGSAYSNSFTLPGTDSTRALSLLSSALPAQAGDSDTIVWHVATGSVRDPAVRARVQSMLARVAKAPSVGQVRSPYVASGAAQISKDGKTAYATVVFTRLSQALPKGDVRRVISIAQSARQPGLEVELGGQAIEQVNQTPPSNSEAIGLVAAALVILVAFGSLGAMALPLLTAMVALGTASLVITLFSHVMSVSPIAPTLAILIGLGVGIDYALFIVTRHRSNLKAGLSPEEAAVRSLNTSGRAVMFAGGTVCIALLGLLVLRMSFLNGMAIAAVMTVVLTMAAAMTILPAMLGFFGTRVLGRRERRRLAADGPEQSEGSRFWRRWAAFVERRPIVLAVAAAVVMVVLALPILSLRLGSSDAGNDRSGSTTRRAYDLLAKGFGPVFNGPLLLVAETGTAADRAALARLTQTMATQPGVAAVAALPAPPNAKLAVVQVYPTTSPQSTQTTSLIKRLRGTVVPAAEQGTTLRVYVGGTTAIFDDFATIIGGKLPLFIAVIVGFGFLLLLVAFRSLLVPATAAIMNLLAAGAAFGMIVALFQWGWGSEALGLGRSGPVESFLPVIMLAILFGLSMDYQVFLVSRMHEEWVHTGANHQSISKGQATTGRVITAAATIMVCVFIAFVFGGQRVIAEFGIGLASAVLLDAFILRTVLVPAVMHLLGRSNWWLPSWLERRLPHLAVEPPEPAPELD
jgi:RND superfamily putative drug exporter